MTLAKIPLKKKSQSKRVSCKIAFNSCTWRFCVFRWRPQESIFPFVMCFKKQDISLSTFNSNEELEEAMVAEVSLEHTSFLEQAGGLSMPASKGNKKLRLFSSSSVFMYSLDENRFWSVVPRNGGRHMFVRQINSRESNSTLMQLMSCVLYDTGGWSCLVFYMTQADGHAHE